MSETMRISKEYHAYFCRRLLTCKKCFPETPGKFTDMPVYRVDPKLFIVGHAPSLYRTEPGFCFGGSSREIFAEILERFNLTRGDVYITNLVKCTIVGETIGSEEYCFKHLVEELDYYKPKQVLVFGRVAVSKLLGQFVPMNGRSIMLKGVQWIPLPHPMLAVYRPAAKAGYFKLVNEAALSYKRGSGQRSLWDY